MKKKCLLVLLSLVVFSLIPLSSDFVSLRATVYAADEKALTKPLMAIGSSLTEEQVSETKRLLGDSGIAEQDILKVDGSVIAKYIPDVENSAQIFSSAYIKPMTKGYGVQVEIVTPSKITKVSATTFQNAAITSGITDVLIRVASVKDVTGEGALAGIYALLEQAGVKVDQTSVEVSQTEMGLIDQIKNEANLSDTDANKFLGRLKKSLTQRLTKKQKITDDWLKKQIETTIKDYEVSLSDGLLNALIAWLNDYATTDIAKEAETIKQLNQSLLAETWKDTLNSVDKVLSVKEILKLEKQDYSDKKSYHSILQKVYDRLLEAIKAEDFESVKFIYSNSFVIERLLENPSIQEKEALNYIRLLCYYAVASTEDKKLEQYLIKDNKPVWLIGNTTKVNWLNALTSYEALAQVPELQEILNRISIATGYSYEAFLYDNISQKGDVVTVTIVCPCLDGKKSFKVSYNVKTGICQILDGQNKSEVTEYDFKSYYGVKLENNYQHLVDDISQYRILAEDKVLFSLKAKNKAAHAAYKKALKEYVNYANSSDQSTENYTYINKENLVMADIQTHQNFYYDFIDVNKDGLDELVVTDYSSGRILGLYVYKDGEAVFLSGSQYRSTLLIFADGMLVDVGSGSAYDSILILQKIATTNELNRILEVYRSFNRDNSGAVTYTIGEYEGSEKYSSEEEFKAHYLEYVKYFSVGERKFVDSDEQADLLDTSNFKDMTTLSFEDEENEEIETTVLEELSSDDGNSEEESVEAEEGFFEKFWSGVSSFWKGLLGSSVPQMDINQIAESDYTSVSGTWVNTQGDELAIDETGLLPNDYQIQEFGDGYHEVTDRRQNDKGQLIETYRYAGTDQNGAGMAPMLTYLPKGTSYLALIDYDGAEWELLLAEEDSIVAYWGTGVAGGFKKAESVYTRMAPSKQSSQHEQTFTITAGQYGMGVITTDDGKPIQVSVTGRVGDVINLEEINSVYKAEANVIYRVTFTKDGDLDSALVLDNYQTEFTLTKEMLNYNQISIAYFSDLVDSSSEVSSSERVESNPSFWDKVKNFFSFGQKSSTVSISDKESKKSYQPVLNEYMKAMDLSYDQAQSQEFTYLNKAQAEWFANRLDDNQLQTVYDFVDIDKDGVTELVVGDLEQGGLAVKSIYTLDGKEVVNLAFSEVGDYWLNVLVGYDIFSDGTIRFYTEASPESSASYFGKIEKHELVMIGNFEMGSEFFRDALTGKDLDKQSELQKYDKYISETGIQKNNLMTFNPKLVNQSVKATQKKAEEGGINEKQIAKGIYSSVEGYWESSDHQLLYLASYGLMPEFEGLALEEVTTLEDVNQTELSKIKSSEDGHVTDMVNYIVSNRSVYYKYVPKGASYASRWNGSPDSIAEEDLILSIMNGGSDDYTIYRRSPNGEIRDIVQRYAMGTDLFFSSRTPKTLLLQGSESTNNLSIYKMDMGDIVDHYNTYNVDTFQLKDVLTDLKTLEERSEKVTDLGKSELEQLAQGKKGFETIYFKGDHKLIFFMPATGLTGPFPVAAEESSWVFDGDTLTVPMINSFDNSSAGRVILKKNSKAYKGGRKKSSYYVYAYEKN